MKIPIPWLEEYVTLKKQPAPLAHELTMGGIEVEHLDTRNPEFPVIDINVPSNRGDLLSVIGVAREIALLGLGRLRPVKNSKVIGAALKKPSFKVSVKRPKSCPFYTARLIRGVKIGPSPEWLVKRLEAAGLRSINNVVDATNTVMLGKGQPLHAFDADKLEGGTIIIRPAEEGEMFKTLEGSDVKLATSDLVIADAVRPVALAGITGGLSSGVTHQTESIVLESAWFTPVGIRHTRRRLGLATESSARFERSIDPMGVKLALDEATALIISLAGGVPEGETMQVGRAARPAAIALDRDYLVRLLGIEIPPRDLASILKRLGVSGAGRPTKKYLIQIPSYRADLSRAEDIIEEIVRLWGIDKVPEIFPPLATAVPATDSSLSRSSRLKWLMSHLGCAEVMSYNFSSERDVAHLASAGETTVEIQNPMSLQERFLRPTLLGGLLGAAARNQANQIYDLKLFEIGTTYCHAGSEVGENLRLGCLIVGHRDNVGLQPKPVPFDYFDIKGVMQTVLKTLGVSGERLELGDQTCWADDAEIASLRVGDKICGQVGKIAAKICGVYELRGPAYYFELDLGLLQVVSRQPLPSFTPLARFPSSFRDLAVVVKKEVPAARLVQSIREGEKVLSAEVFDCYEGAPVEAGHKSLAFHIRYGTNEGTLTDAQVDGCHAQAVEILVRKFGARLR